MWTGSNAFYPLLELVAEEEVQTLFTMWYSMFYQFTGTGVFSMFSLARQQTLC